MSGKLFWLAMTIMLTVMVHIAYLLFVPPRQVSEPLAVLASVQNSGHFIAASDTQLAEFFSHEDPNLFHAICPYDLSKGTHKITTAPFRDYWSISAYTNKGDSFFTINDRQARVDKLQIVIKAPVQNGDDTTRDRLQESDENHTVVSSPTMQGLVVLRMRVFDEAARAAVAKLGKSFGCETAAGET